MELGNVRKNKNRLSSIDAFGDIFRDFPFVLAKVASQNIASADSVHRNIAEGYCSRSIREYLRHLYIAMGSLGETVSGLIACRAADQISESTSQRCDELAFKLENGLLKPVASLEQKRDSGTWIESLGVHESNATYDLVHRDQIEFT